MRAHHENANPLTVVPTSNHAALGPRCQRIASDGHCGPSSNRRSAPATVNRRYAIWSRELGRLSVGLLHVAASSHEPSQTIHVARLTSIGEMVNAISLYRLGMTGSASILPDMRCSFLASLLVLLLILMPSLPAGQSAEHLLTVISSTGLKAVLDELLPEFERANGYKVVVRYGPSAALKQEIQQGAQFDLAVLTPAFMEDLVKQGRVIGESKRSIARAGMAIAGRTGSTKPDIRTTDALTRTLLEAKSIAYAERGAGGLYFAALADRLKIAGKLKSKSHPTETGEQVVHAVAEGDAELGILPLS